MGQKIIEIAGSLGFGFRILVTTYKAALGFSEAFLRLRSMVSELAMKWLSTITRLIEYKYKFWLRYYSFLFLELFLFRFLISD